MKNRLNLIIVLCLFLSCSVLWAESENREKGGDHLAVTAFNEEYGFQMSGQALDTMRITFTTLSGKGPWKIPKESLIHIKQSTGVYRRFSGWIDFVLVNVIRSNENQVSITSVDLQPGDEVGVGNAKFLRLIEADLKSDTVDACAH